MSDLTRQDNNNENENGMPQSGFVMSPMVFGGDLSFLTLQNPQYLPQHSQYSHQSQSVRDFWIRQMNEINEMEHLKQHDLPLARIKKIVKSDEDVRTRGQMISAEVLDLFAKACEIFVKELSFFSWINTEENKRKTLQKNDVCNAVSKVDIYDFLIDIVPREETKPKRSNQHEEMMRMNEANSIYSVTVENEQEPM